MPTLYDAPRCPYCARVRIVLAEKGIEPDVVEIDLSDRPAWLYEKNPVGKVPVWEEDGWALPESAVISEYLEELHPDPPLLPADHAQRPPHACSSSVSTTSRGRTTRSAAARTALAGASTTSWASSTRCCSASRI